MNRPLLSSPDLFSNSPMLAILPVLSQVDKLEPLTSFFFARYEKVRAMRKELADPESQSLIKTLAAEQAMLEQVLTWLRVKPTEEE